MKPQLGWVSKTCLYIYIYFFFFVFKKNMLISQPQKDENIFDYNFGQLGGDN